MGLGLTDLRVPYDSLEALAQASFPSQTLFSPQGTARVVSASAHRPCPHSGLPELWFHFAKHLGLAYKQGTFT